MKFCTLKTGWLWLILFMLVAFAFGCGDCDDDSQGDDDVDDDYDEDDDSDVDDDQGGDDDEAIGIRPLCPADEIEAAKELLVQGKGDAARSSFLAILDEYPRCNEARFGIVLADQLRLFTIIDELLYYLFDPLHEKLNSIDVGAVVVDYCENLLEPMVGEILEQLSFCLEDETFSFELDWLPLRLLGTEILVYAGEYDAGDVYLQAGEFMMFAAALNTVLSADMGFDIEIIIDHFEAWGSMGMFDIILDVFDMLLELLDDPEFPDFLRLSEEGLERMPVAGLQMGYAYQYLHDGIDWIQNEPISTSHEVTGCSDLNENSACDPNEPIKGLFYSFPSDFHQLTQQAGLALRNSYWDGTSLDVDPDNPNPFVLSELNPALKYLGVPPLLLPLKIDFGKMYAEPNPEGIRDTAKTILKVVRWVLGIFLQDKMHGGAAQINAPDLFGPKAVPQAPPSPGLATVTDIAALPYYMPTARTMQLSSHDPTGGNEDGPFPPNDLYVDENGEFVIFDQYGPGCIYRIQFTHTWSFIANLRIYVDDMETPIVEGPFWMLFYLGFFEPFTRPLIENMFTASGTNFIYVPIPFAERCKITFNVPPEYHGVTYVRYDSDTPVTSFTGTEDYSTLRSQYKNVGEDPKVDVLSSTVADSQIVDPGEEISLLQVDGDGAVWQLYIDVEPFTQEAVENLWLVAHWDGSWTPAVEAPVPEFFGSYFIEDAPKTLMMGYDQGRFYSHFPMPFWENAVVKIENRGTSSVEVSWEIMIAEDAYAESAGYFKAYYHEENPVPAERDYQIGERENASGKWIGLTHTMRGPRGGWYLEGDERFYVDGSLSPAVYGTGTEDYYNGGWYFIQGPFTHPMCGSPSQHSFPGYGQTGAYRLHLGDAVHYLSNVRLGIEHGADNAGTTEHYSSVAYFYEQNGSILEQTDALDVGDPADEASHSYAATQSQVTDAITSYYEGEDDEVAVTDTGRIVEGESVFTIAVDPDNVGVILRRRYDQQLGRQRATVLVDGVEVGTWYTAEHNIYLRWAEEDFVLPASATVGKNEIEITIRVAGAVPWTEYAYWALTIAP